MLTTQKLKEFARSRECVLGVANIERFKDAPPMMSPTSIFPEARSVIAIARRIPRGSLRGIEEGTYWPSYTYFGYHGLLNTWFRPKVAYEIACLIEDHGWEAALNYPGVPQRHPDARDHSVKPVRGQSNVQMQVRIAAQAAGIGEISWSKVFMTKEFGTRVRLETILTDAPLEPDPIMPSGTICDRCMSCVKACPSGAIPHIKEGKVVEIEIEGQTLTWGDVDMGKCTLSTHGGDRTVSPFLQKELPNVVWDARKMGFSEEEAYAFCWPLSTGRHHGEYIVEGHAMLQKWGVGGSYILCGARGCIRSCMEHLEKVGRIDQTFKGGPFIKRSRWLFTPAGKKTEEKLSSAT